MFDWSFIRPTNVHAIARSGAHAPTFYLFAEPSTGMGKDKTRIENAAVVVVSDGIRFDDSGLQFSHD